MSGVQQDDDTSKFGENTIKKHGIPHLVDANEAGTKNSLLCTLILTQGISAKYLAEAGLDIIGRDHYGVFALHDKLLNNEIVYLMNVREATHEQISENYEIENLIEILGLQYNKKYLTMDDMKTLRYGKLMIMADQNPDGSNFKGLVINFIHVNWPELLRCPFLEEFITPAVEAKRENVEMSFYSLPEFEEWQAATANSKTYYTFYYSGLPCITTANAKVYFSNMERHRISFKYEGTQDDENIVMAFGKNSVDRRKAWITSYIDECKRRKRLCLYTKTTKQISYAEFVNLELVELFVAYNIRSIPSSVDGLRPDQRKILFTCMKGNDELPVKVVELAGCVAEQANYKSAEILLCLAIIRLAQNFVGSNNINLLQPIDDFPNSRATGGKENVTPSDIFTRMSPLIRLIFHPHDDPLLQYSIEENSKNEPLWYIPIIPMILVNGCESFGTTWSTKIPNHNPWQIINCLRRMLNGDEPDVLHPWYKNFQGTIEQVDETHSVSNGKVAIIEDDKIEITELPIGQWTQTYKENILEPMLNGNEQQKPIITNYEEYHTQTNVRFVISFAPGEFKRLTQEPGGFRSVFKLTSVISTDNMHAFDHNNFLKRYQYANEILKEFYEHRLGYYVKRKDYLEGMLTAEVARYNEQVRLIVEKCNNTFVVDNEMHQTIIDELIRCGYKVDPVQEWQRKYGLQDEQRELIDEEIDLADVMKYDYLWSMPVGKLDEEHKNELLKKRDDKLSELAILKAKTPKCLWKADLEALETKLNDVENHKC